MAEDGRALRVILVHRVQALQVVYFGALAVFGLVVSLPEGFQNGDRVGDYAGGFVAGMIGLWLRGRTRRPAGLEELPAGARVESARGTAVRVVAYSSLLIAGEVAGVYYRPLVAIIGGLALAVFILVLSGLKQTLRVEAESGLTLFQPSPGRRYWRTPSVYFSSTETQPGWRSKPVGAAVGLLLVMLLALGAGTFAGTTVDHVHAKSDRRIAARDIRLLRERALAAEPSPGKDALEAANLDAAAFAVADEFVYAEYVTHDCAESNTVADGLLCSADDARHNEDYLVRDSARLVFDDCQEQTVNLCVEYTVVTQKPVCTVSASTVYPRRIGGRWQVAEEDVDSSSGPCARLWQRRIRYEKS